MWFLGAYSLDMTMKGYTTLTTHNTFSEMTEFIYQCQEREDKLREQCELQMYRIPPSTTLLENLIDTCYTHTNYYLAHTMEVLSYEEFMKHSYDKNNIGVVFTFEGTEYMLLRNGVHASGSRSYANQAYETYTQTPQWSIRLGERQLTVTTIV